MRSTSGNSAGDSLAGESVLELVELVKQGEPEALGVLYDRYAGRVYAFLLRAVEREVAEELLQDVFVALWQKADRFDPSLGSFEAWFFTLVRHRLYDALPGYNKHRTRNLFSGQDSNMAKMEQAGEKLDIEEYVLQLFRDEEIKKALRALPTDQRQAIMMTYFGGYSQKELAEQLNLPVSTIKGRARLGLQKLRQLLLEL